MKKGIISLMLNTIGAEDSVENRIWSRVGYPKIRFRRPKTGYSRIGGTAGFRWPPPCHSPIEFLCLNEVAFPMAIPI